MHDQSKQTGAGGVEAPTIPKAGRPETAQEAAPPRKVPSLDDYRRARAAGFDVRDSITLALLSATRRILGGGR